METRKESITDMTAATLLGDVMGLVKQELIANQEPWQKMSEQKQADALHRIEMSIRQGITKAVKLLASEDRPTLSATIDQVVLKDGVKVVLKLPKGIGAIHDLVDAQGTAVLLVISDPDQHMGGADDHQPDPQQPPLPLASDKAA